MDIFEKTIEMQNIILRLPFDKISSQIHITDNNASKHCTDSCSYLSQWKIEEVHDGKLKMFDSQKFDNSLDLNDTLNKCVVWPQPCPAGIALKFDCSTPQPYGCEGQNGGQGHAPTEE